MPPAKESSSRKAALKTIADALLALDEKKRYNKIDFFAPYSKQQEFFDAGLKFRERLFSAGNQLGKTYGCGAEMVYHLTGNYPEDWLGLRFDRPIRAWCAGVSVSLVREAAQTILCGVAGVEIAYGSGLIPKRALLKKTILHGTSDSYDTVQVAHKSGGVSTLRFMSYEQGRPKFQGGTVDFIWLDEEPPMDVYQECVARLLQTKGSLIISFTPKLGRTSLYNYFTRDNKEHKRGFVNMTIYDVPMTDEERKARVDLIRPSERDTVLKGMPSVFEGRVFEVPEEDIFVPQFKIPMHWWKLWGIDFGISHPFAAVLLCWDKDNDVIYVTNTYRMSSTTSDQHAAAMKRVAENVPVAWPQDGTARKEFEGELTAAADIYRKHGLRMLHEHSQFPEGGYGFEAGIMAITDRLVAGKLKFFNHLSELREEYMMYHRKDGHVVKDGDDLLSALRQAIMMLRYAKQVPLGSGRPKADSNAPAEDAAFSWDWWK